MINHRPSPPEHFSSFIGFHFQNQFNWLFMGIPIWSTLFYHTCHIKGHIYCRLFCPRFRYASFAILAFLWDESPTSSSTCYYGVIAFILSSSQFLRFHIWEEEVLKNGEAMQTQNNKISFCIWNSIPLLYLNWANLWPSLNLPTHALTNWNAPKIYWANAAKILFCL